MKLKVIACDIMQQELRQAVKGMPHRVWYSFLERDGYHNEPDKNRQLLQDAIDAVPKVYDAILLGFALCNRLLDGIQSRHTQLVVPRAHDCITFFLGSRARYNEFFKARPGTYYYTPGWAERRNGNQLSQVIPTIPGMTATSYEEMLEKYGEDNAEYLMELLGNWAQHYNRGALIQFPFYKESLRDKVQQICKENAWQYEEAQGDLTLLQRWLHGQWNEDFLTVPPNHTIKAAHNEQIMTAVPTTEESLKEASIKCST